MSGRGRRGGRGGRGSWGGRGNYQRHCEQLSVELYPEIEGLVPATYSEPSEQLVRSINWSSRLKRYWNSSPYFYEDRKRPSQLEKVDIETYSNRNLQTAKTKPPLSDFIKLDTDHVPSELARAGEKNGPRVKRVRWGLESDSTNFDDEFSRIEKKSKEKVEMTMKEKQLEEEEDVEGEEEEDEEDDFGDDDYQQNEYFDFDDDEDDFNVEDDFNDGVY